MPTQAQMAKLDMANLDTAKLDAWAAFRKASDKHTALRHEASMKRKRDELKFELFSKHQHTGFAVSMLDDNARIDCYKRHTAEKQLDLDRRRHAFDKEVLADNLPEHARALEVAMAAANNLNTLYLERQKTQVDMKLLLDQDRVLLNQREALLDEKEEILRSATYVCSICTLACAEGSVRALDPCGHCLCVACVAACGIKIVPEDDQLVATHTYGPAVGVCPTCREPVEDVLRIFP